ncbi:hypothetical protein C8R47DRAFT_1324546, partial [Mycena vitilis]
PPSSAPSSLLPSPPPPPPPPPVLPLPPCLQVCPPPPSVPRCQLYPSREILARCKSQSLVTHDLHHVPRQHCRWVELNLDQTLLRASASPPPSAPPEAYIAP